MKHKYAAKIHFQDGETLVNSGDDVEELINWINNQAEASFDEVNGEILDIKTQQIVKHIQYIPPEE